MNTEKPSVAHNVDHNEIAKFDRRVAAGGIWRFEFEAIASHQPSTPLATLLSAQAACLVKRYSTSAAAAAFWQRSMAREGATVTGLDMSF